MLFSIVALDHSANHLAVMQDSNLRPSYDDTIIPNVNLRGICFLMNIKGESNPYASPHSTTIFPTGLRRALYTHIGIVQESNLHLSRH